MTSAKRNGLLNTTPPLNFIVMAVFKTGFLYFLYACYLTGF